MKDFFFQCYYSNNTKSVLKPIVRNFRQHRKVRVNIPKRKTGEFASFFPSLTFWFIINARTIFPPCKHISPYLLCHSQEHSHPLKLQEQSFYIFMNKISLYKLYSFYFSYEKQKNTFSSFPTILYFWSYEKYWARQYFSQCTGEQSRSIC